MTDQENSDQHSIHSDPLYTNPLLSDDVPSDNVRAVLAFLATIDVSDCALGDEGNLGLHLVHEWLRRSLAYTGPIDELAIPIFSSEDK